MICPKTLGQHQHKYTPNQGGFQPLFVPSPPGLRGQIRRAPGSNHIIAAIPVLLQQILDGIVIQILGDDLV